MPNLYGVRHKPTKSTKTGDWAVVGLADGKIRSRHNTQAKAIISARIRTQARRAK
jgi:hypothetical protein